MINSSVEINYTLIDKYVETKDKKYITQWYGTEDAVVLAMRLANFVSGRPTYQYSLEETNNKGGSEEITKKYKMSSPDLLTHAYLALGKMLTMWDPDRGKLETFVYTYGKHYTLQYSIKSDLREDVKSIEEFKYPESNYELRVDLGGDELRRRNKAKEKIKEIDALISKKGTQINKITYLYLKGAITKQEGQVALGVSEGSFNTYLSQTRDLIRMEVENE